MIYTLQNRGISLIHLWTGDCRIGAWRPTSESKPRRARLLLLDESGRECEMRHDAPFSPNRFAPPPAPPAPPGGQARGEGGGAGLSWSRRLATCCATCADDMRADPLSPRTTDDEEEPVPPPPIEPSFPAPPNPLSSPSPPRLGKHPRRPSETVTNAFAGGGVPPPLKSLDSAFGGRGGVTPSSEMAASSSAEFSSESLLRVEG